MGGEIEALQARVCDLEEQNDNLIIEKDLAMTKMEQVYTFCQFFFTEKFKGSRAWLVATAAESPAPTRFE